MPPFRKAQNITGVDVEAGFPSQNGQNRIIDKLLRRAKIYIWNRSGKDQSEWWKAERKLNNEFWAADSAWRNLKRTPQATYLMKSLEETIDALEKLKEEQKTKGQQKPFVYLTVEESENLKRFLQQDVEENVFGALYSLKSLQSSRVKFIKLEEMYAASRELLDPYKNLEETSNPELLNRIKDTLRDDNLGGELLDLAEKTGVTFHLLRRTSDHVPSIYDPAAYIKYKNINFINANENNIGGQAVFLGHELRHHWQFENFAEFFKENDSDVDKVVRRRVIEADAHAVHLSIAFVLNQSGAKISWWSDDPETYSGRFQETYNRLLDQKWEAGDALNHVTGLFFAMYVGPGSLDLYERKDSIILEELKTQGDLSEMIAASPYSQPDFLKRLTAIDGESYLCNFDEDKMSFVQAQLREIGRSEYARRPPAISAEPAKFTLNA